MKRRSFRSSFPSTLARRERSHPASTLPPLTLTPRPGRGGRGPRRETGSARRCRPAARRGRSGSSFSISRARGRVGERAGRHVRVDPARRDAVDADAARPELRRERLRVGDEGAFRRGVGRVPGLAALARRRGDEDDRAPRLLQVRHRGVGHEEGAPQVDRVRAVPHVDVAPARPVLLPDPGVVDQDVEAPPRGDDVAHELARLRRRRDTSPASAIASPPDARISSHGALAARLVARRS